MTDQPVNAFAGGDSVPSISFKDAPVGTSYTGRVTEAPSLIQARDYETGGPASWSDGNAKMTVVTRLSVDGEERSLWAPKPSSMFSAIADAQGKAGALIAVGGTIRVTFVGEKPNATNPRLNAQKLYQVDYKIPDAFAAAPAAPAADPWQAPPATAPPAFAAPATVASVAPQWTPEQIAAAKAAGIPLPGIS